MRTRVLGFVAAAAVACGPDAVGPPEAIQHRVVVAVEVVSGLDQSAVVGEALPRPVSVVVFDQIGRPLPGQEVVFTVTSGGGRFDIVVDTTDDEGVAESRWTLGTSATAEHMAEVRVHSATGQTFALPFTALALPGPIATMLIAGDTILRVDRGDTALLEIRTYDQYGNAVAVPAITWQVSDASVASVDMGRVAGVGEGWATVTAVAGTHSAGVRVWVENTPSLRYPFYTDTLYVAGDTLIAAGYGNHADYSEWGEIWKWAGEWQPVVLAWPSDYFSLVRLDVAPSYEFWGVFGQPRCPGGCTGVGFGVARSTDGITWTETIRIVEGSDRTNVAFGPAGDVALVLTGTSHSCTPDNVCTSHRHGSAYLFDGVAWTDLDFPVNPRGLTMKHTTDIAFSPVGDVYVAGALYSGSNWGTDLPLLGRFDGTEWTFPEVSIQTGATYGLEPAPDGSVYGRIHDASTGRARILRLQGGVAELVPTPLDTMGATARGLAVSPAGELAISYVAPDGRAGVIWSTPSGWEGWSEFNGRLTPNNPVWYDGDIWFMASFRSDAGLTRETFRLDP